MPKTIHSSLLATLCLMIHTISELNHSKLKILIAEDLPFSMLLTKTIGKMLLPEATFIEVADGNAAVKCFMEESPDIVLMDVNMPDLNGYEATVEIRKVDRANRVLIIGTSAGFLNAEKSRCLASGMDDYICKPIVKEDLEVMLNKWLPLKRMPS